VLGETELSRVGFTWSAGDPTPEIISEDAKGLTGTWVNGTTDFSYGYSRVAADAPWYSATFAKDVFGSTVATPATLPWAQDAAYDVLGAPANPLADVVQRFQPRFGYRGELAFGSSLDLRARTYDTALGRFTSRDPVSNYAGRPDPASPYAYADDDPVNATDPLGKSALSDAFALLDQDILSVFQSFGAFFATAANACPDPGNGIDRHQKCFQNVLWWTRGFITDGNCLNADPDCLNTYWNSGRKEYAADAFTIHQLDWNRQSVWDSFLNHLGWSTDLSQDVDWEVSPSQTGVGAGRIDIVTEEKQLFEVKDYRNRGMVAAQIQRYVTMGANAGITFVPSTELQDWADAFQVTENWWDVLFGGSTVYVWGLDNPAGHIYFAKDDDAPSNVRTKVWWDQHLGCFTCVPVPEPIPEPVPVPA
jgi:RHS repeat-associated protein